MMRSLYSGVSGLKVHQTKMDVIGNNIANVNTIGFKASSVQFTDVLYQTTKTASGANPSTGTAGTNAQQIGLGASVSAIKTSITTAGGAQRTDNATDLMINGNSFFVVNKGGSTYFTKAGAFTTDNAGNLCTENGALVMGWKADANGTIGKSAVTKLDVMSDENQKAEPEATTKARVTGNIDPADTQLSTGTPYQLSIFDDKGNKYTVKAQIYGGTTSGGITSYNLKVTDIVDSNSQSVFTMTNSSGATVRRTPAVIDGITFAGVTYKADATTGALTTTGTPETLNFNASTGKFVSIGTTTGTNATSTVKMAMATGQGTPFKDITVDYSTMTQYASTGTSNPQGYAGAADGSGAGKKVGALSGISIDGNGIIRGKYDNDTTKVLGQIAVASFSNPAGLESMGGNLFATTANSGEFDGIGQEITQGGGSFTAGALEMSNVDLAKEFTDMIVTQRGYQANSRIITTSDTLLEELINLKR